MKPGSVRPNQRLQEASRCVWGGQEVDPRRIGISAGAKRAVANMGAGLPRDFHTAWVICVNHAVSAIGQLTLRSRTKRPVSIGFSPGPATDIAERIDQSTLETITTLNADKALSGYTLVAKNVEVE